MKFPLMLILALSAIASSHASASPSLSPAQIWKNGGELIDKAMAEKKMEYLLNPIICAIPDTGEIALIYSVDFRHQDTAYLNIPNEGIMPIMTSLIGIENVSEPEDVGNSLVKTQIKLTSASNVELTCVSSNAQLE